MLKQKRASIGGLITNIPAFFILVFFLVIFIVSAFAISMKDIEIFQSSSGLKETSMNIETKKFLLEMFYYQIDEKYNFREMLFRKKIEKKDFDKNQIKDIKDYINKSLDGRNYLLRVVDINKDLVFYSSNEFYSEDLFKQHRDLLPESYEENSVVLFSNNIQLNAKFYLEK